MDLIKGMLGVVVLGLAACGNLQGEDNPMARLGSTIIGAASGDSAAVAGSPALTRELIDVQDVELLRVSLISAEATGLVVFGSRNGDNVTWVSQEGQSFTFREGLLSGTRGLGDDLMGADLSGAVASLEDGGNHFRTLDFMSSLDEIDRLTFECTTVHVRREDLTIVERTYSTTVIEETCMIGTSGFKNTYWRDDEGVIWQARQWISAGVGYLGYQRL